MMTLWQDIRYGVRMLRKSPGFTAVAVLTLALGIGANTAIFTLIETLLLKSLPVKDPQQLAVVAWMHPSFGRYSSFSYPLYQRWSDNSESFSGLFAATGISKYSMTADGMDGGGAGRAGAEAVSGNFFDVLGVPAVLGRTLRPEDDREDSAQAVAVISYGFWQRRFGLDPAIIGKTIRLEDAAVTIVGVTPRKFSGFQLGSRPDLWLPIQATPLVEGERRAELLRDENSQWLRIMGRLQPGVRTEQARAELDVGFQQVIGDLAARLARHISEKDLQQFRKQKVVLETGGMGYSTLRWELQRPLWILMVIAGLVLMVACANVGGLLLARGAARRREFSVRATLGAGRLTLIRQLATESLLVAMVGGVLGLLIAQWGAHLLAHCIPGYGRTVVLDLTLDVRVLAFTSAISAFAAVCFGLIPAWRGSRIDLAATLKGQTGSSTGESTQRWDRVLVASQIAVSCCLLIGAGLFVRTVQKLKSLDAGLNRENLLTFRLDLGRGYDDTRRANLYRGILQRVEGLPGVGHVCCSSIQSLGGSEQGWGPGKVTPLGSDLNAEEGVPVRGTGVTRDYFATMGIPLLRGRDFAEQDERIVSVDPPSESPRPVILDETIGRQLFGQQNPVGRLLRADGSGPSLEVIGVVKDVIHKRLRDGSRPSVYSLVSADRRHQLGFFYVRTVGNPLAVARGIRNVVRELDPQVEVTGLQTMNDLLNDQLFRERSLSQLAGFFSLLALVLACLGLYGTLSYGVVRRTREIGVRMALGAQRQNVLSLVVGQGLKLALIGIVVGLGAALAVMRFVSSLLYGITATDPATLVCAPILLACVAVLASYLPARRAARIDPMAALRYE